MDHAPDEDQDCYHECNVSQCQVVHRHCPVYVVDASTTGLIIVATSRWGVKFCTPRQPKWWDHWYGRHSGREGERRGRAPDRLNEEEQGKIRGLGVPIQF